MTEIEVCDCICRKTSLQVIYLRIKDRCLLTPKPSLSDSPQCTALFDLFFGESLVNYIMKRLGFRNCGKSP